MVVRNAKGAGFLKQVNGKRVLYKMLIVLALTTIAITPAVGEPPETAQGQRERHAIWAHPPDAGKTVESV
ncbi:MAG TPA: hypothetical protein VFP47_01105, partial [Pyrinomonadaceae bacterium]|nr:hypothetical protein [Pyrinomonadaceae bacterium]